MTDSIQLFQFVQKCNQTFGHAFHPSQNRRATISTKTMYLISLSQFMFATATFLMFEATSMFDYGFVFFAIFTISNSIVVYPILVWQSQNTLKFIKTCERFIEKRAHSTAAYIELIGKIELINKLICFGIFSSAGLFLLTVVPYTYARYYIFHMEEDSFYLFVPAWFPFNWRTPLRYLVAWLAQSAGLSVLASIIIHFLNLVFGSCWLFIFIVEDVTQDVVAFNIAAKAVVSNGNRTELANRFCDTVQIYSDAKRCIMEFNSIFQYSLLSFFLWDMLAASSMLVTIQFELWADDSNLMEFVLLTVVLLWLILILFLLCEPGERITNKLVEFSDELSRCDWYLLPIELQRWYVTFLLDTQNPIKVSSYANITCERETSKKMINKAFSYFMTFRRFKL